MDGGVITFIVAIMMVAVLVFLAILYSRQLYFSLKIFYL